MTERPSDYILPSSEAESLRLERQALLYGGAAFLDPSLDLRPARILEVGCGTGFFTRHAAEALPDSEIIGLDADRGRLAFAAARGAHANLSYCVGDMLDLPFEAGSFDLVFSRFVLVHAPDPTRALAEMARVTRPGGWVLAYDMVHSGVWWSPARPAFDETLRAAMGVMRGHGMEPDQGLHLAPSMCRAGLEEVGMEVIPHTLTPPSPAFEAHRDNWFQTVLGLEEILPGGFDAATREAALEELLEAAPEQLLVETTVLAWGQRGAGAPL